MSFLGSKDRLFLSSGVLMKRNKKPAARAGFSLRHSYKPSLFKIGVSGTHFFFSDSLLMDYVRDRGFQKYQS